MMLQQLFTREKHLKTSQLDLNKTITEIYIEQNNSVHATVS